MGSGGAAACGFNAAGDFVCPKEEARTFERPPNPFKRPPASKPPVYRPPVGLPSPQRERQLALGECFKEAIADAEGGAFGVGECDEVRACMAGRGFDAGFTCAPPGGSNIPLLCTYIEGNQVIVRSAGELRSALASAPCGTNIVLAGGSYAGGFEANQRCSAASPLVISAQQPGTAIISGGRLELSGSYAVVSGLLFRNNAGIMLTGQYNRITRNSFEGNRSDIIDTAGGSHAFNRIDHNEFRNFCAPALDINLNRNAPAHQGYRIDHNYFVDHSRTCGTEEVIRILTDAYRDANALIENNIFERTMQGAGNQGELISVKTAGVTVRGNTVLDSPVARITLREANRALIEGNYFQNSGGLYAYGDDHVIRGNIITGGGALEIRAGDGTMSTTRSGCPKSGIAPVLPNCNTVHAAARNALVEDNLGRIVVGNGHSGDNVPAQNTTLRNNSCPVIFEKHTGTSNTCGTPNPTARKLSPDEVGTRAPDPECG